MKAHHEADYRDYVTTRGAALRRTAYLMCGDWHEAEDLVQDALVKLYVRWMKVTREGHPDAWVRRVVTNRFLDERKSLRWRREDHSGDLPDRAVSSGEAPADRDVLLAALRQVPRSQRAVLVLRFWEDMSVEEAAKVLDCSTGNIKSQTARGLERLRQLLPEEENW